MVLKLYMHEVSPGARATLLTAAAIGIEMDEKIYSDSETGERYAPEFEKRYSARTVPSLEDDGFIVNDSHVILSYLVEKYGKNDDLYPKDVHKRARVNYTLYFDKGILFPALYNILMKIYGSITRYVTEEDLETAHRAYDYLENLLDHSTYTSGDFLSIGDLSVITTMSSMNYVVPVNKRKYPNIIEWMKRMENLPYYRINEDGLKKHIELIEMFRSRC